MKAMSLFTALLGAMTCACGAPVTNLEIADFEAKAADPAVFLIDVRTPEEYAEGHLRGAANIDWNAPHFLEQVQAVCPKETPVAVYCRTGRRSGEASKKLSQAGYAVCNLVGGIEGWQAAGKPVTKYAVETFFTDSGLPVRITLIKHGTLEIVYKGLSLHIDPVSGLGIPTDYATEFPKADVILVTHEHGDHFDRVALEALGANGNNLVTNARVAEMLGWGAVMANGDSRELPGDIHLDAPHSRRPPHLRGWRHGGHPGDGRHQGHRRRLPPGEPAVHDDRGPVRPCRRGPPAQGPHPVPFLQHRPLRAPVPPPRHHGSPPPDAVATARARNVHKGLLRKLSVYLQTAS